MASWPGLLLVLSFLLLLLSSLYHFISWFCSLLQDMILLCFSYHVLSFLLLFICILIPYWHHYKFAIIRSQIATPCSCFVSFIFCTRSRNIHSFFTVSVRTHFVSVFSCVRCVFQPSPLLPAIRIKLLYNYWSVTVIFYLNIDCLLVLIVC